MSIRIHFLGATRNVTGSRYLVETSSARVLVDCGLYQERAFRKRNWEPFLFEPSGIDAVILTHAHLDHCGLLPKLAREGFRGPVFATEVTCEIVPIVLHDAAHLQEMDAKYKAKRHRREGRTEKAEPQPLYRKEDVDAALPLLRPAAYRKPLPVADGIEAEFFDAGHILGSASIRLTVRDGGTSRTILFSGDIGCPDRPILNDPTLFEEADYVQMESTYGDRLHEDQEDVEDALAGLINDTLDRGGNVIIPSFAIERAQELLYHLCRLRRAKRIPNLMTFLDSPMAIKVTQVFQRHAEFFDKEMREILLDGALPFSFKGLQMSVATEDSKAINRVKGTVIIIAGSGMCTGGRVKHHLEHNISRPESSILFVGYQATGTLGRQIVDGNPEVRIHGAKRPVRARVAQVHGFSGHGDQKNLMRWITHLKRAPKKVFVTHGGSTVSQTFAELVRGKTGWPVTAPEYQESIELD
jgi:metallo-beta-lactamase family protein